MRPSARVTTVLVVEDEVAIADLLVTVFTEEGYHVVVAHNGQEGLERIVVCRPDVILSDVMMPVLDGIMMSRALHQDGAVQTIPLIFMSAVSLPTRASGCQYAAFLSKPFSLDNLFDTIARVLPRS